MLDRLHAEAEKLAANSQPRHPWPGKSLVSIAAATLVLAVALLLIHGTQPPLRMLLPWRPMPYTHVTLAPSDALPAKYQAFSIHGTIHGRVPDDVLIVLGTGQRLRAPVADDGSFDLTFPEGIAGATTAIAYAAADGISPSIALDLRSIPTLAEYQHIITPPEYTRHPERQETQPSFALLRASQVMFTVTFDTPPTGVRMIFDNAQPPLDLTPSTDSALTWQADLGEIPRTFGYHLEVTDANGTYPVEANAQQVVATPDNPPSITINESNADKLESRSDILTISYSARDDIGLANIAVRYYRVGLTLTTTQPGGDATNLPLQWNGAQRRWESGVPATTEGHLTLQATSRNVEGDEVTRQAGIHVRPDHNESIAVATNEPLMRGLAEATQGSLIDATNTADILGGIAERSIPVTWKRTIPAWTRWWILLPLLLLISAEWLVRTNC